MDDGAVRSVRVVRVALSSRQMTSSRPPKEDDFYEVFSLITMRTILLKEGLGLLALLSVMLVRAMISSQRF
jgi:hypothetical protein